MARVETAEMIAQNRTVTTSALFGGRADLGSYPYKHLAVLADGTGAGTRVIHAVAAAEFLHQYGWDLVNVAEVGSSVYAFMRRRGA